jgi:hypothetical protein
MAKSNNSFIKKQKADLRSKARKEKMQNIKDKRNEPKKQSSFEDMIMYVDANGNFTKEKPLPPNEEEEDKK